MWSTIQKRGRYGFDSHSLHKKKIKKCKIMKNNKKTIALTTSFLLLFVFGSFLFPIVKATETYTKIEEIEDFSCVDDIWLNEIFSGRGTFIHFQVGFDELGQYIPFFKFNLTNKPENYIKAKIVLTFHEISNFLVAPCYLSNNSWTEEELTWETIPEIEPYPPPILPFSVDYGSFEHVLYYINIIKYTEQEFLSICLFSSAYSETDIWEGYSKEYPVESVRPKIIWTVEHEIIISQNNEIIFLFLGLFVGSLGVCVAIGVFMVLNKRKSKI